MRSKDPDADNLFLRLFSYTPRPDREPLEDYCTEGLAWCLLNSNTVRSRFLGLLKTEAVRDVSEPIHVNTQQSYMEEGFNNRESDTTDKNQRGRFDLILEAHDKSFFIAFESKIGSKFQDGQLRKYREQLERLKRDEGFKQALLVTITDRTDKPSEADFHIEWWQIQRILVTDTESTDPSAAHAKALCQQFGYFLKHKGLEEMNLPNMSSAPLSEWLNGMKCRENLEAILNNLKNDIRLRPLLVRKNARFEPKEDSAWFGIYTDSEKLFWLGFGFENRNNMTEVFMLVQRAFDGDRTRELERHRHIGPNPTSEFADGKTWISVQQKIDSEFDGQAMKVRDWLAEKGFQLSEIRL